MKRDTLISWDYFYDSTLYTWLLALDCIFEYSTGSFALIK